MLATQPKIDTIAITRSFDGIEAATHRVITQAGGMASVIKDAKVAVRKPNFVAGRSAETGSTTSFALLKAVAEEVHACGAEPVLYETPGTEFDREATYTILGVEKFCADHGIRIVRIDPEGGEQDWIELRPAGAKRLRRFRIPRFMQEACFINLPVLNTRLLLKACQGQSRLRRMVHVSTTGVHGVTGETPAAEDAPFAPTNPYEATKLEGELLALKAYEEQGLPVTVVRPGLVYGPGDLHLLGFFVSIKKGLFRVIAGGKALLHPVYIDDLVAALLLCAERPQAPGRSYNIAGERPVTVRELRRTSRMRWTENSLQAVSRSGLPILLQISLPSCRA